MPMEEPKIVHFSDAQPHQLHGEGRILRLIYPATVGSQRLFIGLAVVPPGEAPHVFHRHGVEIIGDIRLEYDPDFEEFYFVVAGSGLMQWRYDDGAVTEKPVSAGDAIYMPPGCVEHRIFNSGASEMRVLYGGTPPARITILNSSRVEGR
jgi:mannose-6-phosphate isomerase-like protein (cupin superfamily)